MSSIEYEKLVCIKSYEFAGEKWIKGDIRDNWKNGYFNKEYWAKATKGDIRRYWDSISAME